MFQRSFGVSGIVPEVLRNFREPKRNRDPLLHIRHRGLNREIDQLLSGPRHLGVQVLLVKKVHGHAFFRINPRNDLFSLFMIGHVHSFVLFHHRDQVDRNAGVFFSTEAAAHSSTQPADIEQNVLLVLFR